MLRQILSLFKPEDKIRASIAPIAKLPVNKERNYKPTLIDDLMNDHKILFKIVTAVEKAHDSQKWHDLTSHLKSFRERIYAHLITENVDLYIYLQHSLKKNHDNFLMMRKLQQEMTSISRVIVNFLAKYEELAKDKLLQQQFGNEFKEICNVLTSHIEREEKTLYPMYMPMVQA